MQNSKILNMKSIGSDGQEFAWWVWLANTGKIRDLANDGIYNVRLEVVGGSKCVVVHSVRGWYYISPRPGDGKMMVAGPPTSVQRLNGLR